jgi:hypothetical protein
MAIINSVFTGKSRNSIGNVTTQTYGGRVIAREKPVNVRNPKTLSQQAQRGKMANIVSAWRNHFVALKKFFRTGAAYQSAYNVFVALNIGFASEPIVNEDGQICNLPIGIYLASGQYPEHFLTKSKLEEKIGVTIKNEELASKIKAGDILAIISVVDGKIPLTEHVITETEASNLQSSVANQTAAVIEENYPDDTFKIVWFSPTLGQCSTARVDVDF